MAKKTSKPANERQTNRAKLSSKSRLFANPSRPEALRAGGRDQLLDSGDLNAVSSYKSYFTSPYGLTTVGSYFPGDDDESRAHNQRQIKFQRSDIER